MKATMKYDVLSDLCIIDDVCVETKCTMAPPAPAVSVCCAPKKSRFGRKWAPPENKEEENSMTVNTERQYLNSRLNDIRYTKQDEIGETFRIHNSDQPKTYKELIAAIKDGKYTLDEKATKRVDAVVEDGKYSPWGPLFGIKFDIPTGPDNEGWKAADKSLMKAYTAAKDIINTADAAAGLKALQDFEAWTPAN